MGHAPVRDSGIYSLLYIFNIVLRLRAAFYSAPPAKSRFFIPGRAGAGSMLLTLSLLQLFAPSGAPFVGRPFGYLGCLLMRGNLRRKALAVREERSRFRLPRPFASLLATLTSPLLSPRNLCLPRRHSPSNCSPDRARHGQVLPRPIPCVIAPTSLWMMGVEASEEHDDQLSYPFPVASGFPHIRLIPTRTDGSQPRPHVEIDLSLASNEMVISFHCGRIVAVFPERSAT